MRMTPFWKMGYAFGIKQHTSFSLRNQPFTVPLPSIGRVCLEKSVRVSSTPNLAVLKNPEIRAAIVELLKEYGVIVGSRKDGDTSAPGEADGATADLAIVDGGIAAAPEVSSDPELKMTTWGYLKAKR